MAGVLLTTIVVLVATPLLGFVIWNHGAPILFRLVSTSLGRALGWSLRRKTEERRRLIFEMTEEDERQFRAERRDTGGDRPEVKGEDWDGLVGFFHPFCNAGGGGERVLWAAIRATQEKWPKAKCVVYTGDHGVSKERMLARAENQFSIHIHPPAVTFLYLSTRHWVLASTWPHFTLLGQSLGSIILAWDAFSLVVPDVFIDTMGYAFVLGLSKILFPHVPTGAYVHYPTISTDMLGSLGPNAPASHGVNSGKGKGLKGQLKRHYWKLFAVVYSCMGASVDVVMTNSSWTQNHINTIWGPRRRARQRTHDIAVVYPPCAVSEVEAQIEVSAAGESLREKALLYIAQFRPEKNHTLILKAFATFVNSGSKAAEGVKLILVGSVRDDADSKRVYQLRLLANELQIKDRVVFQLDASWPDVLNHLRRASVGVNGMWNEHFGIGVVEYQAAGLIAVVHDSGGPKADIVTAVDGLPTGFHATTEIDFAAAYEKALSLPDPLAWRQRARVSARRFTEEEFARKWIVQMERLVSQEGGKHRSRGA